MAFREVTVLEVKEILRQWLAGVPKRRIAQQLGLDVKTVRRYLAAARARGVEQAHGAVALTDELVAAVITATQPATGRPRGDGWATCEARRSFIEKHIDHGVRQPVSDPVYLIDANKKVITMEPKPYDKEDEFQEVLEEFPVLLAGGQIDRENPRRWLLVARELGIPDSELSGSRWNLDHLFVDQDGMPTLVEVKRQGDTRIRREVVGQVLDYAANASRYWPPGFLQRSFEETCIKMSAKPDEVLGAFLEHADLNAIQFWPTVEKKLAEGEVRLIFLADKIPKELLRIVEFLNSQMERTEVLAVEVTRYAGQGFSTHIPRLLGQTTDALMAKAASRAGLRRKWDEASFFATAASLPASILAAIRKLFELGKESGFESQWGTGVREGSLSVYVPLDCPRSVVTVQTDGVLKLNFGWLTPPVREALADFVRTGTKVSIPEGITDGLLEKYPAVAAEDWVGSVDALVNVLRSIQEHARK